MTDLLLIRHGEATHNLDGRWEGWGDTELTCAGRSQADAVAQRLATWATPISHVFSSPLKRALQTAVPISASLGLEPVPHDGLREINFGRVNGLTLQSFQACMPTVYARWRNRTDMSFRFPGGEERRSFFQRVGRALDDIIARCQDQSVVVVAHGGTLRAGLAHLLPDSMSDWWAYSLSNASLTHVLLSGDGARLLALDDCSHQHGDRTLS